MDFGHRNYENLLQEGIMAARSDRDNLARRLLRQAIRTNPSDARPWVWLSQLTEDQDERREFLERAVAADPSNVVARRGLALLSGDLDPERILPEGEGVAPRRPTEPKETRATVFSCPQCGGGLRFDSDPQQLICQYCGYVESIGMESTAETLEKPMDLVLPTEEGHRWAESQHRLSCDRCGALTILPVAEVADQCPYCGSNRLIKPVESGELMDPQAIGLMKVKGDFAEQAVNRWLGEGLFTPDELNDQADIIELRPAYYPFWTFDGSLEANWRCEVRQGSSRNARWVPLSGTEVKLFDDVAVPGWQGISMEDTVALGPFKLKELVEFEPGYLAGWPALFYNRSMADASLLARELVVKDLKQLVNRRIEPGKEKRGVEVGAGKWSGMSFKHILLPIWVGTYRHQDETFRVLVNGHTGVVHGEKPQDKVKIALVWVAVVITVIVLVLFAFLFWIFIGGI